MGKLEEFTSGMGAVAMRLNREVPAALSRAYWEALKQLTEAETRLAFERAFMECKFFPAPVELLAFVGHGKRDLVVDAAIAWTAVKQAIQRHDYTVASIDFGPLINTVLRVMGSWEWLCEQTEDDMVWRQKDFERYYAAFAEGPDGALRPEPLIGWGAGKVGCEAVRVAIGGKLPPLALPPAPNPVSDVVRELADTKSLTQSGAAPQGDPGANSAPAGGEKAGTIPPRPRRPTTRITDAEKAEALARMEAQLNARQEAP